MGMKGIKKHDVETNQVQAMNNSKSTHVGVLVRFRPKYSVSIVDVNPE